MSSSNRGLLWKNVIGDWLKSIGGGGVGEEVWVGAFEKVLDRKHVTTPSIWHKTELPTLK